MNDHLDTWTGLFALAAIVLLTWAVWRILP